MNAGRVVVYLDEARQWRWHACSTDGRIDGRSERGYSTRRYATDKARAAHPRWTLVIGWVTENE